MKRWKIKQIAILLIVIIAGSLMAACQKNPDEAVVVDKSEGLPAGSIIDVDNDTSKDLGIPDEWNETLEKEEGFVNLSADLLLDIPDIYNTPVESYEMKHLTNEMLEMLCDYFASGKKLYEETVMTQAELEEEKEKMLNRNGGWCYYSYSEVDEIEKIFDELILEAPEERPKKHYIEPKLTVPYQTTIEKYKELLGSAFSKYSKYYYNTEEEIGFKARVETENEADPHIYAMDYSEELGNTSDFIFSQGTYIDEKEIKERYRNQELIGIGEEYEAYLNWIMNESEQASYVSFSEEDAIKQAEEILQELNLDGYGLAGCYKAIGTSEEEYFRDFEETTELNDVGYSLYFSYNIGQAVGYEQPLRKPYSDLPEAVYAPYFAVEQIHMILTEDGIKKFEWNNISQKKEIIAENTKLLSFEEIKEKLLNHLLYTGIDTFGEDGKSMGVQFDYRVKNVQLRAANITAFEDPYAVWLVPVWVFEMENDMISKAMGTNPLPDKYVVLNAIDGGYVRPQIDVRLEGEW